jgi:hypothetical protein
MSTTSAITIGSTLDKKAYLDMRADTYINTVSVLSTALMKYFYDGVDVHDFVMFLLEEDLNKCLSSMRGTAILSRYIKALVAAGEYKKASAVWEAIFQSPMPEKLPDLMTNLMATAASAS